jgi:hypothetical protein
MDGQASESTFVPFRPGEADRAPRPPAEAAPGIRPAQLPLAPVTTASTMFWPFLEVDDDVLALARRVA